MENQLQNLLNGIFTVGSGSGGAPNLSQAILALNPTAFYKLNDSTTTIVDSSTGGHNLTLTGTVIQGDTSLIPNAPIDNATTFPFNISTGICSAANASVFDITSNTPLSIYLEFDAPSFSGTNFMFGKMDASANGWFIFNNGGWNIYFQQDGSNKRVWTCDAPAAGSHSLSLVVSDFNSSPVFKIDDVAQTLSSGGSAGTITTLTNTAKFSIGNRPDLAAAGNDGWPGKLQYVVMWQGTAITPTQMTSLYTTSQTLNASSAIPLIFSSDSGGTDPGDLIGIALMLKYVREGHFKLIGYDAVDGGNYGAVAAQAILQQYGAPFSTVPINAYQGTDLPANNTTSAAFEIANHFLPGETKTDPSFYVPATFFPLVLSTAANNSVVLSMNGYANSVYQFGSASGANLALLNSKLKAIYFAAGQSPNSSDLASPGGNFNGTGDGENNLGATQAAAVAAAWLFANITVPIYMCGVQICGNAGNSIINGAIPNHIDSTLPAAWTTANTMKYGLVNGAPGNAAAWDEYVMLATAQNEIFGSNNAYVTSTRNATYTVDSGAITTGQNTSTTGTGTNTFTINEKTSVIGNISLYRGFLPDVLNAAMPAPT